MDTMSFKIAKPRRRTSTTIQKLMKMELHAFYFTSKEILKSTRYHAETAAIVGAPGRIDTVKGWAIFVNKLMALP